ncbi:MAG: tyrosine-type recombinase/integrase, partial [Pseudobdellovibrionaceae bacterium]
MNLPLWVEFFDELQNVRGRSLNTVMAYKRDLELYDEFKKTHGRISAFYEFMKQKQLSTRSQARVVSSVRTYLKFVESRGGEAPELRELRPPRVKAGLPKPLSPEEFNRLFSACETPDSLRTARNRVTLLLLYGLGCRVSEMIALDLGDFHEAERWVKVTGKGNKERLVPLTDTLFDALMVYLRDVRPHLVRDKTTAILINDRGHRPSRVDIWRWLAAWSAKAGFEKPVHPHQFRHGCAT